MATKKQIARAVKAGVVSRAPDGSYPVTPKFRPVIDALRRDGHVNGITVEMMRSLLDMELTQAQMAQFFIALGNGERVSDELFAAASRRPGKLQAVADTGIFDLDSRKATEKGQTLFRAEADAMLRRQGRA